MSTRTLSFDYETYSSADIKKVGSYKYIESPDFEVLLLAYAFDDEEPKVVDFMAGGSWPFEFVHALTDPGVIKTAWNCAFERAVTRRALGIYLDPAQCEDTMVLAAQCGLPMSLAGASEALGLGEDQAKMKEGKALIRYFCQPCKPSKSNGQRTRNLPEHDPEKWDTFKRYNGKDVVAERTIRNMLLRWKPSDIEHDFWALDARINDRGVRIDRQLALNAMAMDQKYKAELTEQAVAITGLENPKSVGQIKTWLYDQEGKEFPSLNKKVIADVVAQLESEKAKKFMAIRNELAKTSVAKYDAMVRTQCEDGTVKGCFLFYGASRTGRFCLTGDHEVLTPTGWQRLDAWQGGRIAVWSPGDETYSFQHSEQVSFPYAGEMIAVDQQRCAQIATPDHRVPVWSRSGAWESRTAAEVYGHSYQTAFTGSRSARRISDAPALRVLIMVQADGHYTSDGDIKLGFKKERKVERCKTLLRRAGVVFTYNQYKDGRHQFLIRRRDQPLWLRSFRDKTFGWWLLDEDPAIVIDEIEQWDSSRCGPNSIQYSTTNKQNAEVMQAICALAGLSATMLVKTRGEDHPNWSDAYILNIWLTPGRITGIRKDQQSKVDFSGTVYCAVTPTGYFMVRREGKVWVTGNSGKLVQFQNLAKNEMPDLAQARALVHGGHYTALKLLYDGVSGPLSELIRTAIIPEPGHKLLVSDFAAIEARVTAWFAQEQWRLDVFEQGGDIYCASASQMFHVPVEKHGANSHLRQKGKVAELALGYGGGIKALEAFGADKMGMTQAEMQETVDLWRESSPKVVALWKDLERAAIRAVVRQSTCVSAMAGIRFDYEQGILWMTLPSGRRIAYFGAQYGPDRYDPNKKSLSYMGIDQKTKKWARLSTWGGKLTENLVQATARDCLRESMMALDAEGYDIRAHVHDEVIVTEPVNGRSVDEMSAVMGRPIPWAPGLPLRADGYECPFYQKD